MKEIKIKLCSGTKLLVKVTPAMELDLKECNKRLKHGGEERVKNFCQYCTWNKVITALHEPCKLCEIPAVRKKLGAPPVERQPRISIYSDIVATPEEIEAAKAADEKEGRK